MRKQRYLQPQSFFFIFDCSQTSICILLKRLVVKRSWCSSPYSFSWSDINIGSHLFSLLLVCSMLATQYLLMPSNRCYICAHDGLGYLDLVVPQSVARGSEMNWLFEVGSKHQFSCCQWVLLSPTYSSLNLITDSASPYIMLVFLRGDLSPPFASRVAK